MICATPGCGRAAYVPVNRVLMVHCRTCIVRILDAALGRKP